MDRAREMLGSSDTPATVLHLILLKHYGAEKLYGTDDEPPIDPVLLWLDLEEDFRVSIPVEVENKLNAMMLACSTDFFFTDVEVFSSVCVALATGDLGDTVNGTMERPEVIELFSSITEVDLNDGDREVTFSPNVIQYIQSILDSENIDTEDEVDVYTEEVDVLLNNIEQMIRELGAPDEVAQVPRDSDLYGLLGN